MGQHTERLRELIKILPTKSSKGFTPEIASMCLAQLANGALQVIAELEERNEDLCKEIDRMTEMMVEKGVIPEWKPTDG